MHFSGEYLSVIVNRNYWAHTHAHAIVYLAAQASWTSHSIQIPDSFGFEFVRHFLLRSALPQLS